MKTIKLTRTIRRELPNGVLVYIGPDGITFREKRSRRSFPVTWRQVYWKAMNVAFADEQQKAQPLVEVKPIADDPKQVLMFSDFHTEGSSEFEDKCDAEIAKTKIRSVIDGHIQLLPPNNASQALIDKVYGVGSSEMFDEGINCEDTPACNQENSPLSRDDQR